MDLSIHDVQKLELTSKTLTNPDGTVFKVVKLVLVQEKRVDTINLFVEPGFSLELGDIV